MSAVSAPERPGSINLGTPPLEEYSFLKRGFYMALTPEAHRIARDAGWAVTRQLVEAAIDLMHTDPYGDRSIDPGKHEPDSQAARVVHRLSGEAEALLGLAVAVKGMGKPGPGNWHQPRADMQSQFKFMHRLHSVQQELHPNGIGGLFHVNRPLGIIRCWDGGSSNQWLLMDRVIGGQTVTQHEAPENPREHILRFKNNDYPDLATYTSTYAPTDHGVTDFEDLQIQLAQDLTPHFTAYQLGEVTGNNIIQQRQPDGTNRYTIIDAKHATR